MWQFQGSSAEKPPPSWSPGWLQHFAFPPAAHKGCLLHVLGDGGWGGCALFDGGRLDGCEAAPRCGSDLLSLTAGMQSVFACACRHLPVFSSATFWPGSCVSGVQLYQLSVYFGC